MESGTFAIVGRSSDGRRLGVAVAAALPAAEGFRWWPVYGQETPSVEKHLAQSYIGAKR